MPPSTKLPSLHPRKPQVEIPSSSYHIVNFCRLTRQFTFMLLAEFLSTSPLSLFPLFSISVSCPIYVESLPILDVLHPSKLKNDNSKNETNVSISRHINRF